MCLVSNDSNTPLSTDSDHYAEIPSIFDELQDWQYFGRDFPHALQEAFLSINNFSKSRINILKMNKKLLLNDLFSTDFYCLGLSLASDKNSDK